MPTDEANNLSLNQNLKDCTLREIEGCARTCRGLGETRGEQVVEGEHLENHVEDDHEKQSFNYLCY